MRFQDITSLPQGRHSDGDIPGLQYRVGRSVMCYVNGRDSTGKLVWRRLGKLDQFDSKRQLKTAVTRERLAISANEGKRITPVDMTFAEGHDLWLEAARPNLSRSGLQAYKHAWNKMKSLHACKLTALEKPLASFHASNETTPVASNRCLALVSAVTNHHGVKVKLPAKYKETSRSRVMSDDEATRLQQAIDQLDRRDRAFWLLVKYTGQRIGQCCQVKWENLDLVNGFWLVEATSTKDRKARSLPLPECVRLALSAWKRDSGATEGYVWPVRHRDGQRTTKLPYRSSYKTQWKTLCKTARIEALTCHDLRRSWITGALEKGIAIHLVQDLCGHARGSSQTLKTYSVARSDSLRAAVDQLSGKV